MLVLASLIPCTWLTLRYSDLPQFGKYQDDGLFVIGGKALHETGGYRITSFPGRPFQTKYQPLYPALLAAVWSADPRFPENLKLFSALAWATFAAFLGLSFAVFRCFGFSLAKATGMQLLLALNPWLLYWGLLPISDLPVSVLVLAAFWILRRHRYEPRWWIAGACVVTAACLTKSIGILLVPALWAGAWRGREWKRCLVMTAPAVAAFTGWIAWAKWHRAPLEHPLLWYYTDYVAAHLKNGGLHAIPQIVSHNIASFLELAGNSTLYNLADSMPGRFLSVVILAAAISGSRRLTRKSGAVEYVVFSSLLAGLLLVWNFSPNARLLAPVLPMFAMGLCAELEHAASLVRSSRQSRKRSDRVAARLCTGALLAGCAYAVVANANFLVHGIPQLLEQDRKTAARDREAFAWCKRELPAASVVLANNDTSFYLHSGLSSLRPVPNSVAFYTEDTAAELENFTHFDQFADVFGVTHIVLTPEDFPDFSPSQREWIRAKLLANPRHKQIHAAHGATVLAIERGYAPLVSGVPAAGAPAEAKRLNQAPGQ